MATSSSTIHHHSPIFKLTHSPDSTHSNTIKPLTIHCKKKTDANSPFEPKKSVFVDYDRGEHDVSTRVSGLRKSDIPRRHRLVVEGNRFQKDWTVSEVVEKVLELKRFEDVEGVLNQWVGRFARKNFPFLIKVFPFFFLIKLSLTKIIFWEIILRFLIPRIGAIILIIFVYFHCKLFDFHW